MKQFGSFPPSTVLFRFRFSSTTIGYVARLGGRPDVRRGAGTNATPFFSCLPCICQSQINKHFHIWAGHFAFAAGAFQCYRGVALVSASDSLVFQAVEDIVEFEVRKTVCSRAPLGGGVAVFCGTRSRTTLTFLAYPGFSFSLLCSMGTARNIRSMVHLPYRSILYVNNPR